MHVETEFGIVPVGPPDNLPGILVNFLDFFLEVKAGSLTNSPSRRDGSSLFFYEILIEHSLILNFINSHQVFGRSPKDSSSHFQKFLANVLHAWIFHKTLRN